MKPLKKLLTGKYSKIIVVIVALLVLYYAAAAYQRSAAINNVIAKIKADASWLANVQSKADAAGIALEKQMQIDARWILDNASEYVGKWWNF